MFFPLSQPIIMHYVLSAAVARLSNVTAIDLSNNQLRTLKSLDVLMKMSNLRKLDLRNNEVWCTGITYDYSWDILDLRSFYTVLFFWFQLLYKGDLEDLKVLSQITSLSLDGNPLCAEFKSPREYLRYVFQRSFFFKSWISANLYRHVWIFLSFFLFFLFLFTLQTKIVLNGIQVCLLYTSPSPRD